MTGAVLPGGCDCVVPVEELTRHRRGCAARRGMRASKPGATCTAAAATRARGRCCCRRGVKLRAPEVAIAASAGMARIRVSSQPMLAVISTGNELVEPGEPVLAHQIRRSNAYAIVSALREHGFQRVADDHLHDDADELRERLNFHLDTHDVLVLSGGVSTGRFDLVPEVLERARRAHGVPQGGAAARQAAVVRRRASGDRRLRPAREPRLDAGVLHALCAAGAAGQPRPQCRAGRAHRPGRPGERHAAAHPLPAGAPGAGRLGPRLGACPPPPTAPATSPAWPGPTGLWNCPRAPIPTPRGS